MKINTSEKLTIAVSTVHDGTMKRVNAMQLDEVKENWRKFLEVHNTSLERSILLQFDYDHSSFCHYEAVDESAAGEGILRDGRLADGLATQTKNLALFLRLGDCIGAVLYDSEHEAVMLSHLGRHNLEQNGGQKSVEFMRQAFGTNPARLEVYFSPSAGAENYPLFDFDNKSLAEVAINQLCAGGARRENIKLSPVDTTTSENYFSHSEYKKGHRKTDGRFAIMAMMQD